MLLRFNSLLWIICLVILAILLVVLWIKKRSIPYLLCFSLFWIYMLEVIDQVFFPIPFDEVGSLSIFSRINLVPFYFGEHIMARSVLELVFLNVLLTIPCGFGISFISNINLKKIVFLSISVGVGFELIQFAISAMIGYPYRVIDINDALSNTAGVLLGYLIFRIFGLLYIKASKSFHLKHEDALSLYVYDIVSRAHSKV